MYQVFLEDGSCNFCNNECNVHTYIGNGLKGRASKVTKVIQPDGSEINF